MDGATKCELFQHLNFKDRWSLYVPHSGHYMYQRYNIQQFHVLPTHCIYVFCTDLRTNIDYFPLQHKLAGFYNRDGECLLRGMGRMFISNSGSNSS